PAAELSAQAARAGGPGMPDAWRAAVYSFRLDARGAAPLELLQLLPRTSPEKGRFVRVRMDRARDRYERLEGNYRIENAEIVLRFDGSGGETQRARYYGALICVDDPAGGASTAFRFIRPPDRAAPPPPWPSGQRRAPSRC